MFSLGHNEGISRSPWTFGKTWSLYRSWGEQGSCTEIPLPWAPMSHQEGSCLPQSLGQSRHDEGLGSASLIPGSPCAIEFPCDSLSLLPCPVLALLPLEKASRWLHGSSVLARSYSFSSPRCPSPQPGLSLGHTHRCFLVVLASRPRLGLEVYLKPQCMVRSLLLAWFLSQHLLGDGFLPQVPCHQAVLTC